jgi:uncharacterized delta-60 repeat protein
MKSWFTHRLLLALTTGWLVMFPGLPSTLATPGDLDPSFNTTGKLRIGFGHGDDVGRAVAIQADGKIVAAGSTTDGSRSILTVVRYNTDGSLDTSYQGAHQPYPDSSFVTAVKIQPNDGKVVMAGSSASGGFLVIRLNTDGTLDPGFGTGGIVTTPMGNHGASAKALAIQNTGTYSAPLYKVLAVGDATTTNEVQALALVRYNSDGSLDASFGAGSGKVLTNLGSSTLGLAATLSGSTVVVAGSNQGFSTTNFIVVRYNTDGTLDSSFNNGAGYVLTSIGQTNSAAEAVTIQPGSFGQPNTIVAAGYSDVGGGNRAFALVRYNMDGTRDNNFDGDGIVTTPGAGSSFSDIRAVSIQTTGTIQNPISKIVVGGTDFNVTTHKAQWTIARYNSNGTLDTSFATNGFAHPTFGASTDANCNALVLSGTKILAVGSAAGAESDFATARLNADGSLDSTFDGDGKRTDDIGNGRASAKAIAIQSDGKLIVAGTFNAPRAFKPALLRLNTDGTLDTSFGDGSGRFVDFGSDQTISGVAVQADGKIVIAGSQAGHFYVGRFTADGSAREPDVVVPVPGTSSATALALQPDGKIVVAGHTISTSNNADFAVARLTPGQSGAVTAIQLDPSFGDGGVATSDLGTDDDFVGAVAIRGDGKIGESGRSGGAFATLLYNPNGTVDIDYNGGGRVVTPLNGSDFGRGVTFQPDGKIVVVGSAGTAFGVLRYDSGGSPDSTFNGTGSVITPAGSSSGAAAVVIQANGKIVAAGAADSTFAILRYNADGSLDQSYGGTGIVRFTFNDTAHDFASALALDSSGRAVVAGDADGLFGVARLLGDAPPGLVGNVSTRLPVGTGDNALIEGFIVQGPAGSTKKIIVRAIGPSLTPFGIPDALANPTLEIHDASANNATVATNDDWRNTQVGGLITSDQSAEIASSRVPPSNDLESAIIANLAPGSYTAVVRGAGDTTGTGVVDAYDLSAASPARLANIATRGLIQPGDKLMIAGFIIQNAPVRAVVRAIGPSLSAFGITNALPDTTLQLRDSSGAIVRENDDWQTDQKQELESTGLQPTNDLEAALVATIPPGQYTAQVRGKPETTGIGVVQIYFLQ